MSVYKTPTLLSHRPLSVVSHKLM